MQFLLYYAVDQQELEGVNKYKPYESLDLLKKGLSSKDSEVVARTRALASDMAAKDPQVAGLLSDFPMPASELTSPVM